MTACRGRVCRTCRWVDTRPLWRCTCGSNLWSGLHSNCIEIVTVMDNWDQTAVEVVVKESIQKQIMMPVMPGIDCVNGYLPRCISMQTTECFPTSTTFLAYAIFHGFHVLPPAPAPAEGSQFFMYSFQMLIASLRFNPADPTIPTTHAMPRSVPPSSIASNFKNKINCQI